MISYLTTLKKIHESRNIDNAVINDVVRYIILSKLTFLGKSLKELVLNSYCLQIPTNSQSSSCPLKCKHVFTASGSGSYLVAIRLLLVLDWN